MSLALNVNIANTLDHNIVPSVFSKEVFFNFKETYDNKEELKGAIQYCKDFASGVCMRTDLKLINYLVFNEYELFLSSPNDVLDAESVARGMSPYDCKQYTGNKPTFPYELPKDDPFMKELKDNIEDRKKACVKPVEFLKDEFAKAEEDPISRQTVAEVDKFMQFIEKLFVIEQEKLDFLLDIALLQWNAFDKVTPILKKSGYIKNDSTISAYKSLIEAASLRKTIHEWKIDYIGKKTSTFYSSILDPLFSFSTGRVQKESLIQAIVYLAHGVIIPSTIKELASVYGLDYSLINTFFISGYPVQLL